MKIEENATIRMGGWEAKVTDTQNRPILLLLRR